MSFVSLLDLLSSSGRDLHDHSPSASKSADELMLPILDWLQALRDRSEELMVNWETVDSAWPESQTEKVQEVLRSLAASTNQEALLEGLIFLRATLGDGVSEARKGLALQGLDAQTLSRLLLPAESHLSSWSARQETDEAVEIVRTALGEVGASTLALSFEEQFRSDRRQADRFRLTAIVSILGSFAWALGALLGLSDTADAADVVERAVVAVSLLTLAGFLARESSQHRRDANVWRTVQLQLNHIDTYSAPLSRESREALRFRLGLAIFSGPELYGQIVAGPRGERPEKESAGNKSAGDVLATLWEITEALQDFRGGRLG